MCGYAALDVIEGAVYFYVGFTFVIFPFILIVTGDKKLAILNGFVLNLVLFTKFKEKFLFLIQEEHPEVFADKFVKMTALCFILRCLGSTTFLREQEQRAAELSRAKVALENALDQQKTFVFSFSHELRNPINSLLGNLQLILQGEKLSAKATEMIKVAKVCGEILLHNINNVLDTGKHDIGKLEINPVPTQLSEVFQRTWGIYGELLRQKKLQSQLKIEKNMPALVNLDPHKVNQILLNLIGNSIKFTERGSVIVMVKWLRYTEIDNKCFEPIPYDETDEGLFEKQENFSIMNTSWFLDSKPSGSLGDERKPPQNNNHKRSVCPEKEIQGVLKIIVKDSGCGMKKKALGKLFKKFSQVSENVSQRQIGTGLGLFITKEICLAMGGEIRAYSKVGAGTTLVACIPTIALPVNNTQRANSDSVIAELTERKLTAIVADDSPFNVNLTCDYLSKFGASVAAIAYNGYDGFVKYKECRMANKQLDLVVLDIDMPLMDGRRACDMIRIYEKESRLKPVKIILMSGNYDKEQIDEYISPSKADGFLRKPVSFSDFNRTIYNVIIRS